MILSLAARRVSPLTAAVLVAGMLPVFAQRTPDWASAEAELLRHYQALVQIDTSDPPGHEAPAVEYLKKVLEAEGIPVKVYSTDPKRPNLLVRFKGSGAKKPLLIMAHTDTVNVDPAKWKHPPFGAVREGGYIYGRGTVDDKDNLAAGLMVMLLLKRMNVPLDRDVIFLAEAGEEGAVQYGIRYMVENHWSELDAEFCLAEGGGTQRRAGQYWTTNIGTAEKIPFGLRLTAKGTAGHGSVPLTDNPVVALSGAMARIGAWRTPMRLNDTTRTYFEKLASISSPEARTRYNGIFDSARAEAVQDWLQKNEPRHYSMLRTSISPNMIRGGIRVNSIPSSAEATLDVRLAPTENREEFLAELTKVINDPRVTIEPARRHSRPPSPPSSLKTDAYRVLESNALKHYNVKAVLPAMGTGATDMAFLRERGMQCYGIGPAIDVEDGPLGFGAHSDQERILEAELYKFLRFHWDAVLGIAAR
ncbi:MAG: M20/M25/M40 family metallo-hydrolase [Bryobacteraceae bacterium]|nr:M20/M25/M40 family metallo-hydrolase [Bryobacteraceae bacterium]